MANRLKNNLTLSREERLALGGEGQFILKERELCKPIKVKNPSIIGVQFMGDLFHHDVPDSFIDSVFAIMALRPDHTFLILTKRATRMKQYCTGTSWQRLSKSAFDMGHEYLLGNFNVNQALEACEQIFRLPLPNVWLGVTAENQEQADKRIPILLQIPAAVRFVSVEPMLGPVDLRNLKYDGDILDAMAGEYLSTDGSEAYVPWNKLDWVICGGESGPRARPMHPDWVRSLRDQCVGAGVPFFFKQMMHVNSKLVKMPVLDGRVWDEYPEVTHDSA